MFQKLLKLIAFYYIIDYSYKRLQAQVKKLSKAAHVTWNIKSTEHQRELSGARDKIRRHILENLQQNTIERMFLIDEKICS